MSLSTEVKEEASDCTRWTAFVNLLWITQTVFFRDFCRKFLTTDGLKSLVFVVFQSICQRGGGKNETESSQTTPCFPGLIVCNCGVLNFLQLRWAPFCYDLLRFPESVNPTKLLERVIFTCRSVPRRWWEQWWYGCKSKTRRKLLCFSKYEKSECWYKQRDSHAGLLRQQRMSKKCPFWLPFRKTSTFGFTGFRVYFCYHGFTPRSPANLQFNSQLSQILSPIMWANLNPQHYACRAGGHVFQVVRCSWGTRDCRSFGTYWSLVTKPWKMRPGEQRTHVDSGVEMIRKLERQGWDGMDVCRGGTVDKLDKGS